MENVSDSSAIMDANKEYSKDIYWPKISVITPSYNQGQYIEETILSVVNQNYPNLEYIILDGGSTDETLSIIKKYDDKITHWSSEKDGGQCDAINKGLAIATGEIFAWLNSDDYYLINCLRDIALVYVKEMQINERQFWIVGNCIAKGTIDWRFESKPFTKLDLLSFWDNVIGQPAVFWTSGLINHPILNEDLNYTMDLDLWLRMRNITPPISIDKDLAIARYYDTTKTSTGDYRRYLELNKVLIKHNNQQALLSNEKLSEKLFESCFSDYAFKTLIVPHNEFYQKISNEWRPTFKLRFKLITILFKNLIKILVKK